MNHAQLTAMYEAWVSIEDAEKVLGEYLYGDECDANEAFREDALHDVLGDLIDRNLALSVMLREELGKPVEAIRAQILAKQRAVLLGEGGAQ